MKKSSKVLIVLGVVLAIAGVALRLILEGDLVQIPVVLLVFGGLALIGFAVRRGKRNLN